MNISQLSLVPLRQASLCLDCDMITPSHTHCLACGSVALMSLARTLNGEERPGRKQQELMVVAAFSTQQAQEPTVFRGRVPHRSPRFRAHSTNFQRALLSLLTRPAKRGISAMKYGTWSSR
jgi:hypothetical protein